MNVIKNGFNFFPKFLRYNVPLPMEMNKFKYITTRFESKMPPLRTKYGDINELEQ